MVGHNNIGTYIPRLSSLIIQVLIYYFCLVGSFCNSLISKDDSCIVGGVCHYITQGTAAPKSLQVNKHDHSQTLQNIQI